MTETNEAICATCNNPFVTPHNRASKYCSRDCWRKRGPRIKDPNYRRCTACKHVLPTALFSRSKDNGKLRFSSQCKPCRRRYDNAKLGEPLARFNHSRKRAINRGRAWLLSFEQYGQLICNLCYYCGGFIGITGIGLDRKDNFGDYAVANVVPCCYICNRIKGDHLTFEEMLVLAPNLRKLRELRGGIWKTHSYHNDGYVYDDKNTRD